MRRWTVLGDPTEAALLVAARKGGLDLEAELASMPARARAAFRVAPQAHEHHSPSPDAQRHRTGQRGTQGGAGALHAHRSSNGARAASWMISSGPPIMAANDEYARAGLRVLAVATRSLPMPERRESAVELTAESCREPT